MCKHKNNSKKANWAINRKKSRIQTQLTYQVQATINQKHTYIKHQNISLWSNLEAKYKLVKFLHLEIINIKSLLDIKVISFHYMTDQRLKIINKD